MKNFFLLLLSGILFTSCSSEENNVDQNENNLQVSTLSNDDSFKDSYLKSNLPKVLTLDKQEIGLFKETMLFTDDKKLETWNIELLEKAYPKLDEYTEILGYLCGELGEDTEKIIIVYIDGTEKVYTPKNLGTANNPLSLTSGKYVIRYQDFRGSGKCYYNKTYSCVEKVSQLQKIEMVKRIEDYWKKVELAPVIK